MSHPAAIRQGRLGDGVAVAAHDRLDLVRYATMAASSHNTQPWKFRIGRGGIAILPDFSRRCPAVDPDDHHLYASLGCAAENLLVAAQAAGLAGRMSFDAAADALQVDLAPSTAPATPLFDAIPMRQCTRGQYDGSGLAVQELRMLEQAGRGDGVSIMLLTAPARMEQVAECVAAGNRAQLADPAWTGELVRWIRFNRAEALRTGDGLYGPVMGMLEVPRWLGKIAMRFALSAGRQNGRDAADIRSSGAIAVLFSEADDRRHWIEAGRSYERLALRAALLDLRTAFINQPVEVGAVRRQLADLLGISPRRPDLVVRIGRGAAMPRSMRRPVEEVLA